MKAEPVLTDAYVSFGLPFTFYASSGFMGEVIPWSNLVADLVIALFVSTLLGWGLQKLFAGPGARNAVRGHIPEGIIVALTEQLG